MNQCEKMASLLKTLHIVAIGPIGSGKGTLANLILKAFPHFVQISPGDVLRQEMQQNTSLGQLAKDYITQGSLVPDELIVETVMGKLKEASEKNWILDGFPRTISQAKMLHGIEEFSDAIKCDSKGLAKHHINAVLNLIVPEKVILHRIANRWTHIPSGRVYNVGFREPRVRWKDDETGEDLVQREDDNPIVVCERLKIYHNLTKPVLDFYRFHRVNVLDLHGENTEILWPIVKKFLTEELQKLQSQN